jgi:RNA polymerase-binding transcription factor DksA
MMNEFPMHIEWRRNGAFAVVETITGLEMLVATTHLDLLRHADFKICARADCAIPFPRLSGHKRIYCSIECAHVVAQRALRERKKAEENRL